MACKDGDRVTGLSHICQSFSAHAEVQRTTAVKLVHYEQIGQVLQADK